jgi:gas vesicle protein
MNSSKIAWLLAGATLGAVAGLLCAPQSGEETRRIIGKAASKGVRDLAEKSRDTIRKGRELYEQGVEMTDDAAEMWEREVMERGRQALEG